MSEESMKLKPLPPLFLRPILAGFLVCLLTIVVTVGIAVARPAEDIHTSGSITAEDCNECHIDVDKSWSNSPHAHAYDDPVFQERWVSLGQPGDCLACHTTNYQASSGSFAAQGVDCQACHGNSVEGHPPEPMPIRGDAEYCGVCHTTTISEWRLTGHAAAGIGCADCHNPHSQKPIFEDPDDMCINCHREDMEGYLEDIHVQKDIGCVDCHALVIPPEVTPVDGIVPTGHSFTILPATCVACHTDALHAGFSLPGYENGAGDRETDTGNGTDTTYETEQPEETVSTEQEIQLLQAELAHRSVSFLFQGGVVGLVLGGTTAWIVARNLRPQQMESKNVEEDEEE